MAQKSWNTVKVQYCDRVDSDVALEVQVVYPSEIMPEQPPRILARRCSKGMECNLANHPGCFWSGTNPGYDPFSEPD